MSKYGDLKKEGEDYELFIQDKMSTWWGTQCHRHNTKETQFNFGDLRIVDRANKVWDIEIKLDKIMQRTRRLYIETQEKTHQNNPNFVDSGIFARASVKLYGIGNYCEFYLFDRQELQTAAPPEDEWYQIPSGTSRGFFVELSDLHLGTGSRASRALIEQFSWPTL